MSKIYVIGIGPGAYDQMTGKAIRAMNESDAIIGYTVYVDLVKEYFPGKEFMTTPMKKEVDRCVLAFEEAKKGKTVSMICSGDAGVYGMAGLMYEVGVNYPETELEIIPGVTAATGGAAVSNIAREGEEAHVMTLKELRDTQVDMFTTVFIGNSQTKEINNKMVTPRGYRNV